MGAAGTVRAEAAGRRRGGWLAPPRCINKPHNSTQQLLRVLRKLSVWSLARGEEGKASPRRFGHNTTTTPGVWKECLLQQAANEGWEDLWRLGNWTSGTFSHSTSAFCSPEVTAAAQGVFHARGQRLLLFWEGIVSILSTLFSGQVTRVSAQSPEQMLAKCGPAEPRIRLNLCCVTLQVYICWGHFFFVLLLHCVYALVRFKRKTHLVRVRKTSWVGLK